MRKLNSFALFALSLNLLTSCAVKPPDVPVCVETRIDQGYCTNTISDKEFFVDETNKLNGKTWFEMRPTMIQVPASSWVEIKAFVIKACKKMKSCEEQVSSWERKVETVDKKLEEKKRR